MRLLDMWLRNFMRFKRAHVKLCDAGMTLIEGVNLDDESATSNGAGKSTIVDALVWCLYGVTTHEPSAEGNDVVNEKRGINCEVHVNFVVHNELYDVTRRRAWKKGGKPVQLMLTMTNEGGETTDMTKGTIRDTQAAIDKVLGMSVATFRQACVFGQGRAYRFSRLTDSEKKAVLDEMLGSEVYALAASKASEKLQSEQGRLLKAETGLETALESLQDAKSTLDEAKERWSRWLRRSEEERSQAERELADVSAKLADLKLGREDLRASKLVWESARDEVERAAEAHRKARSIAEKTSGLVQDLEARRSRTAKRQDTACVTCEQTIGASHVEKQLTLLDSQIEEANSIDAVAIEKLDARKRELKEAQSIHERDAKTFESTRERQSKHDKLTAKRGAIEHALETVQENEQRVFEDTIEKARARCKKIKRAVIELKDTIAKRERRIALLTFWQQGFSAKGLRSLMFDSVLPYLNAKLENYTNALTAGNIQVEFKTQRELKGGGVKEDFHVAVTNKHGASKYTMNSIGERAKIDIIVGLALQDMAASRSRVPINVAFFDEVFDGLDDRGTDRAVQVLSQLKRESAFVITHNDSLKTFFSRRIRVVKKNGESTLESS